jgi:RNA polymerase sigma-32 factor
MEPSVASANIGEEHSYHMRDVGKFPLMSAEMEYSLCRRWIDHHDIAAARQLVRSHVCLVTEIAMSYHGRGLPIEDLIGEGHVGLMRAVCRFDPDCGSRFATYAVWWVRAAIQQYILHNWRLVRMGNGNSQNKLFFNLHRVRPIKGGSTLTPISNG